MKAAGWLRVIASVLVLLLAPLSVSCPAGQSVLDGTTAWNPLGPLRDAERPLPTIRIDGPPDMAGTPDMAAPDEPFFKATAIGGGAEFLLRGEASEKRSMRWQAAPTTPQPAAASYFRLQYRATGIAREYDAYPVVQLSGQDEQGNRLAVPLLDCHGVLNDGCVHVLMGRMPAALSADEVLVRMATEDSRAWLRVESLELYADRDSIPPAMDVDASVPTEEADPRFAPLALAENLDGTQLNDSVVAAFDRVLDGHQTVVDGGRGCPAGAVAVHGIPFHIAGGERNMVQPDERSEVNTEQVEFLGQQVARRSFFRPSRDDTISVALGGRRASEVFFLLVCEMPPVQTRYGLPSVPFRLDDVEAFAVELVYEDGRRDWAYPYSLADGGCVVARMLAAYAVAADPSRGLERIVFHNRLFGVTMSVAAVTLNTAARRIPALVDETPPIQPPRPTTPTTAAMPPARPVTLTYRDGLLTGGNAHYQFTIDCRQGFSLSRLSSGWSPDTAWSVDPSSGLEVVLARRQWTEEERNQLAATSGRTVEVEVGKTVFTGRAFAVDRVDVAGGSATIRLRGLHAAIPLDIVVRMAVDESPHWTMSLEAVHRGQAPLEATIRFPSIRGLALGEAGQTWLFFPQYRAMITRDNGYFTAMNGPYFPHQFFDAFNPAAGAGLMTLTHNLEQFPLEYSMRKTADGVDCGVAYPGQFHALAPGQTFRAPEASLIFHAGDWRQAMREYQDWLKTWYRPRRVQGDWWRPAFVMRSHIISPDDSQRINHTPSILDRATGQYRVDEAMDADQRYWGRAPDLIHFYAWYFRDREKSYGWGEYGTPEAYAQAGGLDALRQAIGRFQENHHAPVSLYTIGDRCSLVTTAFGRFGESARMWRSGAPLPVETTPEDSSCPMCWGYRPWQDHCVADLTKLQRDTGAKIIYLDVFPLQKGHACDCPEHGHETPLWFDRTSREVLSRVRESLPPGVAIYSEYPMSDVASQDIDGNVAYYNLPLHRHFDKLYDVVRLDERASLEAEAPMSIYRYVFPEIKQFCFAVGVEHSRSDSCLKIPFFHGDAEYGVTWRLKPERVRQITNRGLAIQKRYLDCFTTDHPQPGVRTERRGVHANSFPAAGRTLWTLWNARYQTVRGPVLAVDHKPGARYLDAWNDRPLEPEIRDGQAILSLEMEPQGLGCVVQTVPPIPAAAPSAAAEPLLFETDSLRLTIAEDGTVRGLMSRPDVPVEAERGPVLLPCSARRRDGQSK